MKHNYCKSRLTETRLSLYCGLPLLARHQAAAEVSVCLRTPRTRVGDWPMALLRNVCSCRVVHARAQPVRPLASRYARTSSRCNADDQYECRWNIKLGYVSD
jgi:hypothetical protein